MIKGKPFVKWAGGKRQVIDKLKLYAPDEYNTYYEPFVGGGALLFELSPRKAVINDYNEELMNIFNCITRFIKHLFQQYSCSFHINILIHKHMLLLAKLTFCPIKWIIRIFPIPFFAP